MPSLMASICGLSPRGRGKQASLGCMCVAGRSIPAWAGETRETWLWVTGDRVYPRVGGGNIFGWIPNTLHGGLSPRGRGKPINPNACRKLLRSIPAWAGETGKLSYRNLCATVYPRVGGGNCTAQSLRKCAQGLSPRGRGKRPPP